MRFLVTGSTGLVGRALASHLEQQGHQTLAIRRDKDAYFHQAFSDPKTHGADAVVHLAGEPILGRWTPAKRRGIEVSRVEGSRQLVLAIEQLPPADRPKVLVAASAIGYYGDTGDAPAVDESAPAGQGFLADVCVKWEAAVQRAADLGVRVVLCRFGVILSRHGGALGTMLLPFQLGLGGPAGSGRQWMSWISLRDVVRALEFTATTESAHGAYNFVAPTPVQNAAFAKALGHVLHRPAILPTPAFALRLLYGECADATVLGSTRVLPQRLQQAGFSFEHADVTDALRWAINEHRA